MLVGACKVMLSVVLGKPSSILITMSNGMLVCDPSDASFLVVILSFRMGDAIIVNATVINAVGVAYRQLLGGHPLYGSVWASM